MYRRKIILVNPFWILILFLVSLFSTLALAGDDTDAPGKLVVGVAEFPPFSMKTQDGRWEGLSVELWQRIAKDMAVPYKIREFDRLKQIAEAIQNGSLDLGTQVSVTEENEINMDLSHAFYRSGLGVAVPTPGSGIAWIQYVKRLLSVDTVKVIVLVLSLSLIAGAVIWLLESKKNQDMFGDRNTKGLGHGIWWAIVTMTTVGYGDKAPRTLGGRIVAVIWMFLSVILIAGYTAVITSSLTVDTLQGKVKSPRDLPDVRVGSLAQSETLDRLQTRGIGTLPVESLRGGLQAVVDNKLDALVDDEAQLRYIVKNTFPGQLRVLPETFDQYYISMAMPSNSPLREPLNRALTKIINTEDWVLLKQKYMGVMD